MPDVLSQPLMMPRLPIAFFVFRVFSFQFPEDSRSKASVDKIIGIVSNHLRPINLHASPSPLSETENFSIELIWELLCPCGKLFPQVLIQNCLQSLPVSKVL